MKVVLIAHQDDEIFLLPYFNNHEFKLVIFLTNGVPEGSSSEISEERFSEAKEIFHKFLIPRNCEPIWWGNRNQHFEGSLHRFTNSDEVSSIWEEILLKGRNVSEIITTTFEGAHQDHDAAAYISRKLANKSGLTATEISTYPQKFKRIYSFSVLKPGNPEIHIKFKRLAITKLAFQMILAYKTQRKTWLGLGIQTLYTYALRQYWTSSSNAIKELNPCFYEFRGRSTQKEVLRHLLK